jgi:hypothetical protein
MKSYTTGRNLYGKWTKNASTANLTLGDEVANDEYRTICAMKDWAFLHKLRTVNTIASTQFVNLPYDVDLVESVYVTISSQRHVPKLVTSREEWDQINLNTSTTSDIPRFAFVFNGQIGLWPIPSTSSNVISVNAKVRVIDLSIADITSSTITTLTAGSTALTVSGGLTVQMAGFWIRPTLSTTANTGDGQWYEISSVTNSTTATLVRAYGGTNSIAAGSAACTISQMPLLPENFHDLPWIKAAADYWYKEADTRRGDSFQKQYDSKIEILNTKYTAQITDLVLDEGYNKRDIINPNLTVNL